MELKNVTRKTKEEPKIVRINLRITKSVSKWLSEKNVSPQKVFDLSIVELIEKDKKK